MNNFSFSFLLSRELNSFKNKINLYKIKHIFTRNKKYFDWRFRSSSKKYNILLLKYKKRIVSILCFYPLSQYDNYLKDNKVFFMSLAFNIKNIVPFQMKLLFDYFIKKKKPKIIFTSPLENLLNYNKFLGFKFQKLDHYFFKIKKKTKIEGLKNFTKTSRISFNKIDHCRIISENEIKKLKINLFNYQYPLKSKKYLINKYLKHPVFKYIFLGCFENQKITSLIILRVQIYKNLKIGRIVDFVGNQETLYKFNNILCKVSDSKNFEYIDFYNFGILEKNLIKAGFFNKKHFNSVVIPDYFNPYENKNINLYMGIICKNRQIINNINYYKGDCDLDTPK